MTESMVPKEIEDMRLTTRVCMQTGDLSYSHYFSH